MKNKKSFIKKRLKINWKITGLILAFLNVFIISILAIVLAFKISPSNSLNSATPPLNTVAKSSSDDSSTITMIMNNDIDPTIPLLTKPINDREPDANEKMGKRDMLRGNIFKLSPEDYGGYQIDSHWLGKSLADFMEYYSNVFYLGNTHGSQYGSLIEGIKGSQQYFPWLSSVDMYFWKISSLTDDTAKEKGNHPDWGDANSNMTDVGASSIIIKEYNVFYFTLCYYEAGAGDLDNWIRNKDLGEIKNTKDSTIIKAINDKNYNLYLDPAEVTVDVNPDNISATITANDDSTKYKGSTTITFRLPS